MDCSTPGFPVHHQLPGLAHTHVHWVGVCVCVLGFSRCVQLFVTLWAIANQAPLLMRFSKQEYWSGLPCPSPEKLTGPGIEPTSLVTCIGRRVLDHQCHLGRPKCSGEQVSSQVFKHWWSNVLCLRWLFFLFWQGLFSIHTFHSHLAGKKKNSEHLWKGTDS